MPVLMTHVWALGFLVIAVNLVVARVRMRALVIQGAMTAEQANRFCLRAAVIIAIVAALFESVTWLSGVPTPCQLSLPFADPRLLPFHVLTALLGAALLYWVWRRGGDRTLAMLAPAFSRGGVRTKIYTPRQVRVWLTVLLVRGVDGLCGDARQHATAAAVPRVCGLSLYAVQPRVAAAGACAPPLNA
jgi:hypothetical protein